MARDNQDQLGWGNHDTVVTGSQGSEQVSKIEWNDSNLSQHTRGMIDPVICQCIQRGFGYRR